MDNDIPKNKNSLNCKEADVAQSLEQPEKLNTQPKWN